jgi:hypothetical protein
MVTKIKHKWVFDEKVIINVSYNDYGNINMIYHCEHCGEIKIYQIVPDWYEEKKEVGKLKTKT